MPQKQRTARPPPCSRILTGAGAIEHGGKQRHNHGTSSERGPGHAGDGRDIEHSSPREERGSGKWYDRALPPTWTPVPQCPVSSACESTAHERTMPGSVKHTSHGPFRSRRGPLLTQPFTIKQGKSIVLNPDSIPLFPGIIAAVALAIIVVAKGWWRA